MESTEFPVESDIDLDPTGELTDPEEFAELTMGKPPDGRSVDVDPDDIDPNSLSLQSIDSEFALFICRNEAILVD